MKAIISGIRSLIQQGPMSPTGSGGSGDFEEVLSSPTTAMQTDPNPMAVVLFSPPLDSSLPPQTATPVPSPPLTRVSSLFFWMNQWVHRRVVIQSLLDQNLPKTRSLLLRLNIPESYIVHLVVERLRFKLSLILILLLN